MLAGPRRLASGNTVTAWAGQTSVLMPVSAGRAAVRDTKASLDKPVCEASLHAQPQVGQRLVSSTRTHGSTKTCSQQAELCRSALVDSTWSCTGKLCKLPCICRGLIRLFVHSGRRTCSHSRARQHSDPCGAALLESLVSAARGSNKLYLRIFCRLSSAESRPTV